MTARCLDEPATPIVAYGRRRQLCLTHDKIREVLYEELNPNPPPEAAPAHRRRAEQLYGLADGNAVMPISAGAGTPPLLQ